MFWSESLAAAAVAAILSPLLSDDRLNESGRCLLRLSSDETMKEVVVVVRGEPMLFGLWGILCLAEEYCQVRASCCARLS